MDALSDDLLYGAAAIAEYMFGDKYSAAAIYHLAATGQLPLGKMGEILIGRKSTLTKHVAKGERITAPSKA